jgi:hypothetical protein
MARNRLYLILALACLAGYSWLFFALHHQGNPFTLCFIKAITGIPCPSCGTTRSIICLARGDVYGAVKMNPLGLVSAAIMLLVPLGLLYDLIFGKSLVLRAFNWAIETVRRKWTAIILIALVAANWIWNICKHI